MASRAMKYNKRRLPDLFSAALQTSRDCGRYESKGIKFGTFC